MGVVKASGKVKVFASVLCGDETLFQSVEQKLSSSLGLIEFTSPIYPWTHTRYYENEMGPDLKKIFLFFKNSVEPDTLPDIKVFTNNVERYFMEQVRKEGISRPINIDPGYITLSKVVLASTKDYFHRLYLGKGIYGEVTLYYRNKTYRPFPYTYPDYRSDEYIRLFNMARERLLIHERPAT